VKSGTRGYDFHYAAETELKTANFLMFTASTAWISEDEGSYGGGSIAIGLEFNQNEVKTHLFYEPYRWPGEQ